MNTQNRFKSWALWTSIVSGLLLLLGEWRIFDLIGIEQELIRKTIDFILLVLVQFGIINNPTNKNGI